MDTFSANLLLGIGLGVGAIVAALSWVIINKSERVEELNDTLIKLNKSFNELDEQAKLIVKTDLELNKAQEELDRRLGSLDALQKTSRMISTTLDENEIYTRLDQALVTNLGFERSLIFVFDQSKGLHPRIIHGFSEEEIQQIIPKLGKDSTFTLAMREGQTFSSVTSQKQRKEMITRIFDTDHFVISPILTQNGMIGVFFVGNRSNASPVTEGDEELISILANQIGQSLENARLFEQVFRSTQILETRVQERTKELASALDEVKAVSQTKSDFISAVSHELRTPLTSIKGYASLLITGKLGDIPLPVKERLEKIDLHSDNLVKLINDLLDISRIESGKVEMSLQPCQIHQLVENIHDLLIPQLKNKDIQWVMDISTSIPEMILDIHQVERIFINLIGNATKFTPEKGTIAVKAEYDKRKEEVTFHVSDTGIGISEEDLKKLFNEFYRVENKINQNVKGTGLGLSLAKKIIEAHKGKIWVTSKVGEGTTFHFILPIRQEVKTNI
jgi:signal transduction histidine kinase